MTIYSDVLEIFRRQRIGDEKALASYLQRSSESGVSQEYYSPDASSLGEALCGTLVKTAERLETLFDHGGIQQFSLSADPRVKEDDVRKALFLSRTAAIFTRHRFSFNRESLESLDDSPGDRNEWTWTISHDFVRDVFRFRDAIERGLLVILPSAIHYHGSSTDLTLLKELERTKVIQLGADARLVDAIVARYKMDRQLISLPDVAVPWIQGMDVGAILKVREDYTDSIDAFQRAYHQGVLAHIENRRSLDFARISRQINQDLIAPQIARIERDYKQAVSHHRSIALVGAAVSAINVAGVIVSGALLNRALGSDVAQVLPSAVAGLLAAVAINRLDQKRAVQELEDEAFYVLWKIRRG